MPVDSDLAVFDRFNDGRASRAAGLLAFACYAEAKHDWERHFTEREGVPPSNGERQRWILDQSDKRLDEIMEYAIRFFAEAADEYLAEEADRIRQEAVEKSILSEVGRMRDRVVRATSFWATIWTNLFMGVISGVIASFVFAAIVIAGSVIFQRDPSIFSFFKHS